MCCHDSVVARGGERSIGLGYEFARRSTDDTGFAVNCSDRPYRDEMMAYARTAKVAMPSTIGGAA